MENLKIMDSLMNQITGNFDDIDNEWYRIPFFALIYFL